MKRKMAIVFGVLVVSIVLVSVGIIFLDSKNPERVDDIGGKFNAVLKYWSDNRTTIEYVDETGKHVGDYFVSMKDSLDWIKVNTPEDSLFLCWWDYGHMIKGYAERNVVVRDPSEQILESVTNAEEITQIESHETIVDVATAFSTTDSTKTLQIMETYDASYIVVNEIETQKAFWIFQIAGLNTTEYAYEYWPPGQSAFTDKAKETMLARLVENRETNPFSLVYSDETIKVYEIK